MVIVDRSPQSNSTNVKHVDRPPAEAQAEGFSIRGANKTVTCSHYKSTEFPCGCNLHKGVINVVKKDSRKPTKTSVANRTRLPPSSKDKAIRAHYSSTEEKYGYNKASFGTEDDDSTADSSRSFDNTKWWTKTWTEWRDTNPRAPDFHSTRSLNSIDTAVDEEIASIRTQSNHFGPSLTQTASNDFIVEKDPSGQSVVDNTTSVVFDDGTDTYGETIINHFKKERLERHFNLHRKPRLLSNLMTILILLLVVTMVSLISLLIHWIVNVRKANLHLDDLLVSVGLPTRNRDGSIAVVSPADQAELLKKLDIHMVIYLSIFMLLLPLTLVVSIVFDFASPRRLTLALFTLKLVSFGLFFAGWFHIKSEETSPSDQARELMTRHRRDFGTHGCFNEATFAVFVLYLVITGVKLAGHLFHRIFRLRLIGGLFRIVVSDWFVGSTDHLVNSAGLLSIMTGIGSYLFVPREQQHFQHYEPKNRQFVAEEEWLVRSIVLLLICLFTLIAVINLHRHYISNHRVFITPEDFLRHFARFRHLYEPENVMDMGQDMPKVTSALRMV